MPPASTALLLCAHGSPGSGEDLARRAAALGRRLRCAETAGALLYGDPPLEKVVAGLTSARICVVPLLLSEGTTFAALRDRLQDLGGPARFTLCRPLGTHPWLAAGLLAAAEAEARRAGWSTKDLALVLVGHGSRRNSASREATQRLARQVGRAAGGLRVDCAFLEEPPALDAVLAAAPERRLVVAGCFSEQGRHARKDVPALIAASGREVRYLGPIGAADWTDTLILDSAARALAETGQTITPQQEEDACLLSR
ncbi:MAG: CbiX/SirB N-terminal domain-containing protein [Kiloniellales bacterium]|nr:CbiX/SirB N-terminal domain-containing protein [Kiloniellales bacterium]